MFKNNEITRNDYGYSPPCPSKKGGAAWQRSGGGTSAKVFRPNIPATAQNKTQKIQAHKPAAGQLSNSRKNGAPEDCWATPVYNGGYNSLRESKRGGQPGRRSGGGVSSDCFRPQVQTTGTVQLKKTANVEYPKEPAGITASANPKPSRRAGALYKKNLPSGSEYKHTPQKRSLGIHKNGTTIAKGFRSTTRVLAPPGGHTKVELCKGYQSSLGHGTGRTDPSAKAAAGGGFRESSIARYRRKNGDATGFLTDRRWKRGQVPVGGKTNIDLTSPLHKSNTRTGRKNPAECPVAGNYPRGEEGGSVGFTTNKPCTRVQVPPGGRCTYRFA